VKRVLRICASHEFLPREECAVPERCEERTCEGCGAPVHYDPKASIPALGPELVVCQTCANLIASVL
jgi:hypothetical protein